jgi:hypothetical protein
VRELFPTVTVSPLAVRGERLTLSRTSLVSPNGLEASLLNVSEFYESGRCLRHVTLDDTDVVGALVGGAIVQSRRLLGPGRVVPNTMLRR